METRPRRRTGDPCRPWHTVAVALILVVLAGCSVSGAPPWDPGAIDDGRTPVVRPTGSGPTGTVADDAPATTTEPDPQLEREIRFSFLVVDTGESTPMPASITDVEGMANIEVSPDGTMLAFDNSEDRPRSRQPGIHQIFIANVDGSGLRQVTSEPLGASEPSWSPDAGRIVYVVGGWAWPPKNDRLNLSILDLGTGVPTVVTETEGRSSDLSGPHFWDAESIVFTRWDHGYDLWMVSADGGGPTPFLEGRGYAWLSPDGTSIIFPRLLRGMEGNSGFSTMELWVGDADGGHPRVLVPEGEDHGYVSDGIWSPNGEKIAFHRGEIFGGHRREVFVLDVDTGRSRYLTTGSVLEWLDDRTLIVRQDLDAAQT